MTSDASVPTEILIEPGRGSARYWRDLWTYRELFFFLAWRDVLVRYKQTVAGVAWAWLRPLAGVVVSTIVFGEIARLPSGNVPYPLMVMAGMLPWQLFSNTLADSGSSVISNANLISKVYFPRMLVPASSVITGLADFVVALVIGAALMFWYGVAPTWHIIALPWFIVLALGAAFGAGLWVSALTVRYRDFRFIVPFFLQFGFFITPVAYATAAVPARWSAVYAINPLVGVIDGFRWSVLPGGVLAPRDHLWSVLAIALCVVSGSLYFRRTERSFADVI